MLKTQKRTNNIGGEALIEGVMMKSPECIAMAVRKSDGEIVVEKKPYQAASRKCKALGWPVIRGAVSFFESMVLGVKALTYSAEFIDIEGDEGEKESKFDKFLAKIFGDKLQDAIIYFSVVVALILGIGIFMLLPNFIAGFFKGLSTVLYNIVEGVIRMLIFLGYILLIANMKDIQRVFQYHGAEHKTIHCYEHEEELAVENIRKYSTLHPRCGTSFMLIVMLVSILVFSFLGWPGILMRIASRILLIPLIAGLSYEVIRFAGKSNSWLVKYINAPGMGLQRFTTREPDEKQLEVAIAALRAVLPDDGSVEGANREIESGR